MSPAAESAITGTLTTIVTAVAAAVVAYIVIGLAVHKGLAKTVPNPGARQAIHSVGSAVVFGIIFYSAFKGL